MSDLKPCICPVGVGVGDTYEHVRPWWEIVDAAYADLRSDDPDAFDDWVAINHSVQLFASALNDQIVAARRRRRLPQ